MVFSKNLDVIYRVGFRCNLSSRLFILLLYSSRFELWENDHCKSETRFREFPPFSGMIKKRAFGILVIFQGRTIFSHINGKISPRPY